MGAGGGAALSGLGTAAVKGLTRLADLQANKLTQNAIRATAENTRTPVASPFAEGTALNNPIAKGYTENVGRTFGNGPSRVIDDVATNRVIPPTPSGRVVSNTEAAGNRSVAEPVIQPAPQVLTRSNVLNQVGNGNFSDELNSMIKNADNTYERATNAQSVAKANENLKTCLRLNPNSCLTSQAVRIMLQLVTA